MARHLMIVPSLACLAACKYCFGPHEGIQMMNRQVMEAVVAWQKRFHETDSLEITFHGGEPLVAGVGFYREALPLLRDGLTPQRVKFGIQSNLWLFNDEFGELFLEYKVAVGTSLDGPEGINDAQRGQSYFRKTWAGIELAIKHGLRPGCICTFSAYSRKRLPEIINFFAEEGLDVTVHSVLPSLRYPEAKTFALSVEEHGYLLLEMLDLYLTHLDKIKISTLDRMIRSCDG